MLPRPVPIRGAGGETIAERMVGLPGYGGRLVRDCLMVSERVHSLLHVPLVCGEEGSKESLDHVVVNSGWWSCQVGHVEGGGSEAVTRGTSSTHCTQR